MSFLNSLLGAAENVAKNAVKDATRNVTNQATGKFFNSVAQEVKNVVGDTFGSIQNSGDSQTSGNSADTAQQYTDLAAQQNVPTVAFTSPAIPASAKWEEAEEYDCTEDGREIIYVYRFPVAEGFVKFDSGAGEVTASYAYSPKDVAAGWCEDVDFRSMPVLCIEDDGNLERILSAYVQKGTVKSGTRIEKITGSFVEYKTYTIRGDHEVIAYHFHKKGNNEYYSQIAIEIPDAAKGQRAEWMRALDCMVAGLQVTEKNQ